MIDKKKSEDLARELLDFVNDFAETGEEFMKELVHRSHPTLKQSVMRLFVRFVEKVADQEYFDGRDEASVKLAKAIVDRCQDEMALPCI